MKYSTFIPAVLLSLTSVNALAGAYICKPITGTIQQLTPDPACNILQAKPSHFPDVTFLFELTVPDTCFSGNLQATLGDNTPVTGASYSGVTLNGIGQFTAASAIILRNATNNNVELGRVYTQDVIFAADNPAITTEYLTMVSGSKMFKGGHGHLEITGNALFGPTGFTGVICTEN
jgi:hypothetical protein